MKYSPTFRRSFPLQNVINVIRTPHSPSLLLVSERTNKPTRLRHRLNVRTHAHVYVCTFVQSGKYDDKVVCIRILPVEHSELLR